MKQFIPHGPSTQPSECGCEVDKPLFLLSINNRSLLMDIVEECSNSLVNKVVVKSFKEAIDLIFHIEGLDEHHI